MRRVTFETDLIIETTFSPLLGTMYFGRITGTMNYTEKNFIFDSGILRIITVGLSLTLVILFLLSVSRIVYPFDLGHQESVVWTPASLSVEGYNPFAFAKRAPFVMAPYGYFYYVFIGLGMKLFGVQFVFGRIISVIATLICAFCIARIGYRFASFKEAILIAVIFFFSSLPLQTFIATQRPDIIGLSIALLAFTYVICGESEKKPVGVQILLVSSLFVAGFFFKQTIVLPILFTFAYYLQKGFFRCAFYLLGITGSLISFVIYLLNSTSNGDYVLQHFIFTRSIPSDYSFSMRMLFNIFLHPATLLITVIPIIISFILFLKPRLTFNKGGALQKKVYLRFSCLLEKAKSERLLIYCYFFTSLFVAFITSARAGANVNYYLETIIVGSVYVSILWSKLIEKVSNRNIIIASLLFIFLTNFFSGFRLFRGEYFRWEGLDYYNEIVEELKQNTNENDICISAYPDIVVAAGRKYHFGDSFQYLDGRSPELKTIFYESVNSGNYKAIVWHSGDNAFIPPGYELIQMKNAPPERFYKLGLYLQK